MQVENKHETGVLVRLESACRELAEAMSIHEVKEIRDKAAAIKDFMRQRRYGQRAQNDAAELKLVRIGVQLSKFVESISMKLFPAVPVRWMKNFPHAGWLWFKTMDCLPKSACEKSRLLISGDEFLAAESFPRGTALASKQATFPAVIGTLSARQ